jgi:hypothetical protein
MAVTGPFRVSFFFVQQGDRLGGWSVNLWNNQSSVAGVTAAATDLQFLLWSWTGNGVNAPYIRVSQVGNFRSAFIINTSRSSPATGGSGDADFVDTALLVRLIGPQPYFANQWLRGIPDAAVTTAGRYTPRASDRTAFLAIRDKLAVASNGWVLRNLNQSNAKQLITAVTLLGVVSVAAHGFSSGQSIRISRTGGMPGLNKVWKIVVIDSNTFQLVGLPIGGFTGGYTKPGTAQLQAYLYQAITDMLPLRATKHNTGRPFGLLSGRRRRSATTGS